MGGGAFINKTIRENILKNDISVWLDVDIQILSSRMKHNQKRPLLNYQNSSQKLEELYSKRKHVYELANHRIICDKLTKNNIAERIITLYEKY